MPLLLNTAVIVAWLGLHASSGTWLLRAWTQDEGRLHLVLAALVAAWLATTAPREALVGALRTAPRASLGPLAVLLVPAVLARVGPDLHTLHALLAVVSGYGLLGLWARPATWRAAAVPWMLLAAVVPVTGHLDVLLGYPLRRATAAMVAMVVGGTDVGTVLTVDGRFAHVDLPCSGVRGLWSTTVVLLAATMVWGRSLRQALPALVIAIALQLFANLGRVAALVALQRVHPFLAELVHLPLGVLGFALGLVGPLALIATTSTRSVPSPAPTRRSAAVAGLVLAALLCLPWLPRPTAPTSAPAPAVRLDAPWAPMAATPQEEAFFGQRGGTLTKAVHPKGASVALVSSHAWTAHHSPEQCHEAGGWTLASDRPVLLGDHVVRWADAERDGEQAIALWWFQSPTQHTDDQTARIRAAYRSDEPWVLVSVLLPGRPTPADTLALVDELILATSHALEPR